jgi:hypothetical protein
MEFTVAAKRGLVTIDTLDKKADASFAFALATGAYVTGPAVGCQVNTPELEADILEMGHRIAEVVLAFGEKHPELGILDTAGIAVANARKG